MLARYKLYRGSRADDDPLPVGIRQDSRKHTGHCLRPSEEAVAEYLASGDESAWRIFAADYAQTLADRLAEDPTPVRTASTFGQRV